MVSIVPVRLKVKDTHSQLIINIPVDYCASQLLAELVDACELEYMDDTTCKLTGYYSLEHKNIDIAPNTIFDQTKILRGDELYLRYFPTLGQRNNNSDETLVTPEEGIRPNFHLSKQFWKEVRRNQAVGYSEKALRLLLEKWFINFRDQKFSPELTRKLMD